MKVKYISIIIFLLIMSFCTVSSQVNSTIVSDHSQSKKLIDRFNKLRTAKNLKSIQHDTILDNISNILINNERFKNNNNTYKEDSLRLLLYEKGIIDYQYEIIEFSDKDATSVYKSFFLNDLYTNLRVGFSKSNNRNILFITKSYLKFCYGTAFCKPIFDNGLQTKIEKLDVKTDSIFRYFRVLKQGKYYYQFSNRIPLSTDKMDNTPKREVTIVKTNNKGVWNEVYDFAIKSTNSDMFLIISNKNNERVVVIK